MRAVEAEAEVEGRRCSGASDGKRAGVARDEQRDQARPRLGLCRHSAGLGIIQTQVNAIKAFR